MKKLTLLFVTLPIFLISYAQTDADAKKILNEISANLKTSKGITANFSFTAKDRNNQVRESVKGTMSIKGEQYYIKHGTAEIYCNGLKVWNYDGEAEVTVTNADDSDDGTLAPQKLLTNFYDKDYTYKLVSNSGNYNEILLMPIDKRKNFKQITIYADKSKDIITKAKVVDKSDNTIELSLYDITSASIPDSRFIFNASNYPGIEIISQ